MPSLSDFRAEFRAFARSYVGFALLAANAFVWSLALLVRLRIL